MRAAAAVAGVFVLVTSLAGGASAQDRLPLSIRLYNTAQAAPPELLRASHTAESILADMNPVVRHCGRCPEPLAAGEVVVRIVNAPSFNTSLHPDAFGVTYVPRNSSRGWLATVFADRIRKAAARTATDAGTLLGRVIAHEVGHLLLGAGYHGRDGVMPAEWPDALLSRTEDEWLFSAIEAAQMQRTVAIPTNSQRRSGTSHRNVASQ